MDDRNEANDLETYLPPQWLTEVLRESRPSTAESLKSEDSQFSEDFIRRCHEGAGVAISVEKLRRERQRIGFIPLSFAEYIYGLLKLVDVSLSPVLSWLGIENVSRTEVGTARAFARLAQAIGMSLREAIIHIRIGFAMKVESAPIALLVARHRPTGRVSSPLASCETVLEQIESEYDLGTLRELRNIESEFNAVYRDSN